MDAKLVALKLFLTELGVPEKIETVRDRKRVQKAIYVGQLSGVDLGYRFGWYLMGPYSPALTRDYYDLDEAIGEGDKEYEGVELKAPIRTHLSQIKSLFSVPSKVKLCQEDWLELLSSVHFLRKVSGYDKDTAHSVLEKQKPQLVDYESAAEAELKKAALL
jgi:uncharacterized protein YwgA